ncbi:MAG: (Fe-S)-binding protein [Rhodanobacter sp.]|jgi:glycolate oxidase iron-sulfur subunit|nr:(Fe-S)-binding protein [Rhodanobacter sp.]
MPLPTPELPDTTRLLALTDQCVMCGLCLPHCPTYRLAGSEAESPRGRIALARALATAKLTPSASVLDHLDHCLACLSCQKVCPSQVRYETILVETRAALARQRPAAGRLARWLRDPRRMARLARIGAALRADRWLPALGRRLPQDSLLGRLAKAQPALPRSIHLGPAPRPAAERGRVTLFGGCLASTYDRDTLDGARHLLRALGYAVAESGPAQCCGALPRHAGDIAAADARASATRAALRDLDGTPVLTTSSGCFGDLREHVAQGASFTVADALAFIAADADSAGLRFKPLSARVALHLPCTQVNAVGATQAIRDLLARIPGLTVLMLPEQPRCCGAAGTYFIEHADFADRLREEKLDQAQATMPDLLLTTHIGCRIHLGNGLRERAAGIPVLHPLALLAQQLDNATP